tara:strand:+ start:100 stop:252 length:153 start_codon:yes stop_codon:yes gene_type:complete
VDLGFMLFFECEAVILSLVHKENIAKIESFATILIVRFFQKFELTLSWLY